MKKRMCCAIVVLAIVVVSSSLRGQDTPGMSKRFTNHDVISLVESGISEDVIIAKIRELKAANVPDSVIKVMINPAPAATPIVMGFAAPMTSDPNLPPPEVGVYWKNQAHFMRVEGQALTNMKVGGKAGSLFTDGLRNQHWDAYLEGPVSKTLVQERFPGFYIYVTEGTDSSDYVLLKLNKKGDRREFQIGSFGGITGGKAGVKRDKEVPFKAEHVGMRTYKISLEGELKPGEYAFFMGTGQSATMSGARGGNRSGGAAAGRIYDFSIPE
jgi:hypothetical protein